MANTLNNIVNPPQPDNTTTIENSGQIEEIPTTDEEDNAGEEHGGVNDLFDTSFGNDEEEPGPSGGAEDP